MRKLITATVLFSLLAYAQPGQKGRWISLFDGKSFDGWKVGANANTFSIKDGAIKVNGNVAHLFYNGKAGNHSFKNFEFQADVMTLPGSNSGIYFHTLYQEGGWPEKGYEVQVNNSHTDWRRSGSLWAIQDIKESYVKDNEWYSTYIKVKGKRVTVRINGKQVVDYTEPENPPREEGMEGRKLSAGTFALQGHDPGSTVYYKNIKVRVLPD
ncbi:MAG: DUF1080 domain-containing protein [Bacteroidota bacterium]